MDAPTECACGCGLRPFHGRRFLQGHDAKHYHAMLHWLKDHRPEVYAMADETCRAQSIATRGAA